VCSVCGYIHYGDQPPEECPVCGSPREMFELDQSTQTAPVSSAETQRVFIVGAGIAGVSAAEALRRAAPSAEIVLISNESCLPYYRLNLTRYLAGEISAAELPIHPQAWYVENDIRLVTGCSLCSFDLAEKKLTLRDGSQEVFDWLILTTGSSPFRPPFPGIERANVMTLRTWRDADAILALCQPGKIFGVIGGGLLGLETAGALANGGVKVTVFENQDWLLPRQLNRTAAGLLRARLGDMGIQVKTRAKTAALEGCAAVSGVLLDTGECIPVEGVVISAGIRSNIEIPRQAGLAVNQGILVDDGMRSSHPDVFAAGDVAEHGGMVYGIWPPSQMQGVVAGSNAAGGQGAVFRAVPRSNNLKVLGIDLYSIGRFTPDAVPDRLFEVESGGDYACFNFNGSHLAGAILFGNSHLAARVKKVVEGQQDCLAWLKPSATPADILAALEQAG
jgi:nitrite reductase (NADH) large subunit